MERLRGKQAQLFLTETCDLACVGCPYPRQTREQMQVLKQREICPQEWKEITDYLYSQGNRLFCLIGGEPGSYNGIDRVIAGIVANGEARVLLSTSGLHMLHDQNLRRSTGEALAQSKHMNGIAISFDGIPLLERQTVADSRSLKASQGLEFVGLMQREFPDKFIYVANVMVTPANLGKVLQIQEYLEKEGVYTNLCTQQGKCFGEQRAVFDENNVLKLREVGAGMIERKIKGSLVVNSVAYLSQLPGIIGMEDYRCWEEPEGNPVIDVGPDGQFRYCSWIGQELDSGPPGVASADLISGRVSRDEFFEKSKEVTAGLCTGCSWSRRDRQLPLMVEANLPDFDPRDPKLQNIWVRLKLN